MNINDIRKLLYKSTNKLDILSNFDTVVEYNLSTEEFINLVLEFLSDEEKLKLLESPNFKRADDVVKAGIIDVINDENVCLEIKNNDELMKTLKYDSIVHLIRRLGDEQRKQILYDGEFFKKYKFNQFDIEDIVFSLHDKYKNEAAMDNNLLVDTLHFSDSGIIMLYNQIQNEEAKVYMLEKYDFLRYMEDAILREFSNESKLKILLNDGLTKDERISLLKPLDARSLGEFLKDYMEMCKQMDIKPYEIIKELDTEKQKCFIDNLEDFDFTLDAKRCIFASLNPEVKEKIDINNLPNAYKTAISINTNSLDFNRSLEDYRGLDDSMVINPEKYSKEQRKKLFELCDICPNMKIANHLANSSNNFYSSVDEYKEAEMWIDSVIDSLNPEWSKLQKLAAIDNAIGKKISYAANMDTEVQDIDGVRALWKIISKRLWGMQWNFCG